MWPHPVDWTNCMILLMGSIYTFKYYLDIHVESIWNPHGMSWNPHGMSWNVMESMESTWNIMESIEGIVMDSTWIPEEYSMEYPNSMILPYGMNMEKNSKMAGLSAKNIPYGISMDSTWIPPGMWGHSKDLSMCSILMWSKMRIRPSKSPSKSIFAD